MIPIIYYGFHYPPMDDIRRKLNLVALIAAIGELLALIGTIIAGNEFPGCVGILDYIIFGLGTLVALSAVKPTADPKSAMWNIILGGLGIVITTINYLHIAAVTTDQSFTGVGIGIWIAFIGVILFTIFSISDYTYKRNAQKSQ